MMMDESTGKVTEKGDDVGNENEKQSEWEPFTPAEKALLAAMGQSSLSGRKLHGRHQKPLLLK